MRAIKRTYTEGNLAEINATLADIIYSRTVTEPDGQTRPLSGEISRQEIYFLIDMLGEVAPLQSVLEIGCAFGISSIVISQILSQKTDTSEYIILDPHQSSNFHNIGVDNVRKAGFSNFELREVGSETELPKMMESGKKFDVIFQDGMKTMDHSMLEFHYLDKLLRVGGVLIYDDVDRWGMNKFIRYISLYPHWKILASSGEPWQSHKRKFVSGLKRLLHPLLSLLPRSFALEIFSDTVIRLDKSLGLNSSMLALRKTADDPRDYTWNVKF